MIKTMLISMLGGLILAISIQLTHNSVSVDDNVVKYYNKFIAIANKCETTVNKDELRVEIQYNIANKPYYAVTYTELNLIVINYAKFNRLEQTKQEQTIIHELGHALLNLEHNDDDLNLMNTIGFMTEQDYVVNYDYYIRKLFEDCKYTGVFVYGKD